MKILSIDAGTTQSGYCVLDDLDMKPQAFGKIDNYELLGIVKNGDYDEIAIELFRSYGMAIGESTIRSITWNGRYIQSALDLKKTVHGIYRADEKMNLCGTMKAKDANIRQALIDRFAKFDFKNGKGTKKEQDWFYGFSADSWSAYAIGITYFDMKKRNEDTELFI